jgi:hypothetical protein
MLIDLILISEKIFKLSQEAGNGDICTMGVFTFRVFKTPTSTEWVFEGHSYYDTMDLAKVMLAVEEAFVG